MSLTTETGKSSGNAAKAPRLSRRKLALILTGLSLAGWAYLLAILIDMTPNMDMAAMGPGMGVFNIFNDFGALDLMTRELLASICLTEGNGVFGMPGAGDWGLADLAIVFFMWLAMALAMMIPTAVPMILAFHDVTASRGGGLLTTLLLTAGYVAIYAVYALLATLVQWSVTEAGAFSPASMAPMGLVLAGTILLAAGLYQFTPAKIACLSRCRAPVPVFQARLETGNPQPFALGLEQGLLCAGSCWLLMGVMFAVGTMNILWTAGLALIMLLEKLIDDNRFPRAVGVALCLWGLLLIALSPAGAVLRDRALGFLGLA